jgi:hypothetical protein
LHKAKTRAGPCAAGLRRPMDQQYREPAARRTAPARCQTGETAFRI